MQNQDDIRTETTAAITGLHHITAIASDPQRNVDFYAGVVYFLNGIAEDLFVPIFAVGRVPGWTVQVLEQLENNILLRPLTLYNGPEPRHYLPIEAR